MYNGFFEETYIYKRTLSNGYREVTRDWVLVRSVMNTFDRHVCQTKDFIGK